MALQSLANIRWPQEIQDIKIILNIHHPRNLKITAQQHSRRNLWLLLFFMVANSSYIEDMNFVITEWCCQHTANHEGDIPDTFWRSTNDTPFTFKIHKIIQIATTHFTPRNMPLAAPSLMAGTASFHICNKLTACKMLFQTLCQRTKLHLLCSCPSHYGKTSLHIMIHLPEVESEQSYELSRGYSVERITASVEHWISLRLSRCSDLYDSSFHYSHPQESGRCFIPKNSAVETTWESCGNESSQNHLAAGLLIAFWDSIISITFKYFRCITDQQN